MSVFDVDLWSLSVYLVLNIFIDRAIDSYYENFKL